MHMIMHQHLCMYNTKFSRNETIRFFFHLESYLAFCELSALVKKYSFLVSTKPSVYLLRSEASLKVSH